MKAICDGLSKYLGLNVSIFVAGPMPALGGKVAIRSMHSGKTLGAKPLAWPDFDKSSYRQVENSMLAFSQACFSAYVHSFLLHALIAANSRN